nr:polymorphic toxin-type HINT domain-containing protein [Paenibacillus thiaminolyticus]
MRRWLIQTLICILFISSVPLASAQETLAPENPIIKNDSTVTSSVYDPQAISTDFDSDELITITSITETFSVNRDWVVEELLKGYELHQIYQGLKAKQQGKDYEQFMNHAYRQPAPDPIIIHQEQVKSVLEAVYKVSVTEQVYDKKELSVVDSVYGLQMFSDSDSYDKIALRNKPIRLDQAPYSVGAVSDHISTVDGSLRVEVTDLVMPGPNGMDFALRRIYDSSLAKDDMYVNEYGGNRTRETKEEEIFRLGKGWIWDISYIKRINDHDYIYISGAGTYALEDERLIGYPLGDLDFRESNRLLQSDERASYELLNKTTGVTQYFNQIGELILIEDKDSNWIQFSYKYQPDLGRVLYRIQSWTSDHRYMNEMNISYNGDNTVTIQTGDRRVIYKKEKVKKIKNDYLHREQDILTEVIDPLGRSTKYDYGVWNILQFNLVRSYENLPPSSNERRIFWGENEMIALGVIEHPTKAITEFGFEGAIERKIGDFAVEKVVRYKSRRNYYSSPTYTRKNELTLRYTRDGDGGQYIEKDLEFSVEVYDKFKTTTYTYDKQFVAYDAPSAIYNTKTEVRDVQTDNRQVFHYDYDRFRRNPNPIRLEETHYQGGYSSVPRVTMREYDYWGQLISETDPFGVTSRYEYTDVLPNKLFVMTKSSVPIDGISTLHSEYEYETYRGKLKQAVYKNERGEILRHQNYEYDYIGNPVKIRIKGDTDDTVIYQEFSPNFKSMYLSGQIVGVKNVEGRSELVESRMEYHPESGLPTKYTDGNGNSTSYMYDKLGRITSEINSDGTKTTVVYDDHANKMFITDPNGLQTEKHFDPLGNLIAETNGRGIARHTYDEIGRLIRKGDFNGSEIQYEYDAWDRVIKENFLLGANRIVYDDVANTRTTFDGANNGIRETYDIMNRLIRKEEIKPSGQPVVMNRYEYNLAGNISSVIDGNNNVTGYLYDVLGRLIYVSDAAGEMTRYRYNLSGDMVEIMFPDGNTVQKRYDNIGRLLEQTDPNKQSKRFYYDGNGNVIKSIDRKGQFHHHEYNSRNLLTAAVAPDETISYSYDATGKRMAMTDQTGTTSYAYYPSGELASITYPDKTVLSFDYDKRGMRKEQAFTSGAYRLASQTERDFLLSVPRRMKVVDGTGGELTRFDYSYDHSYNRIAELKSSNGMSINYDYDGLNMVGIQQKQGEALFWKYVYSYDNNRNIIRDDSYGAWFEISYDSLNRIERLSKFNELYTYDSRNNRSTLYSDRIPNIKGANYTYDSRNRLTQVTTEDGKAVSYRYNGDNLMVERTEGGVTTRYYYDDRAKIVAEGKVEANGSVTITVSYIHDDYGKLLARQIPGQSDVQYYVTNGHGDITEIRDARGNELNRYTYDIWGKPLIQQEKVPNNIRYSGEYWDAATELQYLRARWYDPGIGRFLTEDAYEGEITNPLSLNLYTYVYNNPLIYSDPTGNFIYPISPAATCAADMANCKTYLEAQAEAGKKVAVEGANFLLLDDINTLISSEASFGEKALAAASLNPFGKVLKIIKAESKIGKLLLKCNCFTAGTKVLTDEGEKPIEEIEVGDKVLAKEDETGEMAYKEVEWLFQRDVEETYNITVGDEVITTTDEHPFWIVGKGWMESKDLVVGDVLTTSDGNEIAIDKIEVKKEHKTVYNFKVKDFHTYFVSNFGIWTHNSCGFEVSISKSVERVAKKLSPEARKGYDSAIEALKKGDTRGLNEHPLSGNRKGQWAVDIKGTGKGRGAGRIIYTKDSDGTINVIQVLTDHNYKR